MSFSNFHVDLGMTGTKSKVLLDGTDITNSIRAINIECGVDHVTTVTCEFLATVEGNIVGELRNVTPLGSKWKIWERVKNATNRT